MEQKEIRLNAGKRKSLTNDYRRHCESLSTELKDQYNQSREEATSSIASAFETATTVVQRRFPLEDVAVLQELQRKHNTINAVGNDSCFYFKVDMESNKIEECEKVLKSPDEIYKDEK